MCWGRGNVREVEVQGNVGEVWESVLGCGGRCVKVENSGRSKGKVWGE